MKKNNKGFSLVELIVVVLILGILAVAVTPQIMNWINKSKIAKDESYAGSVATAIESVTLEYVGKNLSDCICSEITIANDASGKPALTAKDKSGTAVTFTETPADKTAAKYLLDVRDMIGKEKIAIPEQSNRSKYIIKITPNATTSTVTVEVTPTT